MSRLRALWQRYLTWRRAEGVAPAAIVTDREFVDNSWAGRIDADPGEVAVHATSNRAAGSMSAS